ERDTHPQRPPPHPVERGRQLEEEEARDVGQPGLVGAGDAAACGGEQSGELGDEHRVRGAGAQRREVARRPLVERDELVRLAARELPPGRQGSQALPLRPVHGGEGVDVHAGTLPHMTTPAPHSTARALQAAHLNDDLIVTGEAVALEVRPAAFMLRVVAGLIDAVCYGVVLVAVSIGILSRLDSLNEARMTAATITTIACIIVVAPTVVETWSRGRSLGKLATGIRVVRDDGGPIRFRHAFIRSLTGLGELWLTAGSIAVMTALLNGRGK